VPTSTKRTLAQIRREFHDAREERERRRSAVASDRSSGWDAFHEAGMECTRLAEELTVAEADEEERRDRQVRSAVRWAAVAALASAVAAGGTWWQATHAPPPLRGEVIQPAAPPPLRPGPLRLDLCR